MPMRDRRLPTLTREIALQLLIQRSHTIHERKERLREADLPVIGRAQTSGIGFEQLLQIEAHLNPAAIITAEVYAIHASIGLRLQPGLDRSPGPIMLLTRQISPGEDSGCNIAQGVHRIEDQIIGTPSGRAFTDQWHSIPPLSPFQSE